MSRPIVFGPGDYPHEPPRSFESIYIAASGDIFEPRLTNSGSGNVWSWAKVGSMPGGAASQGLQGEPGNDGEAGASAYELAVAAGFVGTLEQWLESLKGETGERGAQGEPGQNGEDGVDGANGNDGAEGPPGTTEWDGITGKPATFAPSAHTHAQSDITNLVNDLAGKTTMAAVLAAIYPVGVVVTLGVSTNPGTLFGIGTWTAIAGRVIVGIDAGQTEFDALDETGGAKTVTLDASMMPTHTHTQDAHTHTQNSHNHTQDAHTHTQNAHSHAVTSVGSAATGSTANLTGANDTSSTTATAANATAVNQNATATNQAATATNQNATATNQNTGGGGAHNNLQPYIVKYVWQRTA